MGIESKNMRTLIVILNWNGAKLTLDCCKSLSKLTSIAFDVLIVDNFSQENDYLSLYDGLLNSYSIHCEGGRSDLYDEYAIESIKKFSLDNSDTCFFLARSLINHGFARGCNFGARYAKEKSYPQILLLNNDTVVEPNFLSQLFLHKDSYDIVIPQIRYFEPDTTIWNCGGSISFFGKRKYFYANQKVQEIQLPDSPFPISFATGCCMLIETSFYIDSGMFTEDFFFGEEDIDYALRLKKKEAKVSCVPSAIIYHKVGASLAGDEVKLRRKAFIHFLNRFINMKKHLHYLWVIWLIPATIKMFITMMKVYKLSLMQASIFSAKIVQASLKKNKVEKKYFEDVMKCGY